MVAGFERYFQFPRCFRDEDQRSDRMLEFEQLDMELSFASQEDILALVERLVVDDERAGRVVDDRGDASDGHAADGAVREHGDPAGRHVDRHVGGGVGEVLDAEAAVVVAD